MIDEIGLAFDGDFSISYQTDKKTLEDAGKWEFDSLPYKNKIVFTNKPYSDITSSVYIKGFENESCVGVCYEWMNRFSGKRIYDQFDYVRDLMVREYRGIFE